MRLMHVSEPLDLSIRYHTLSGGGNPYRFAPAGAEALPEEAGPCVDQPSAPVAVRLGEAHRLYLVNSRFVLWAAKEYVGDAERGSRPIHWVTEGGQERALAHGSMPRAVGCHAPDAPFVPLLEQLQGLPRECLRLAMVNIFDDRLGDGVLSLVLLRELRSLLEGRFARVEIDLLQNRSNPDTDRLYLRSGLVDAIRLFPLPLAAFARYHAYTDFSSYRLRDGVHWLDDCLVRLGIDPASVPAARKRMWLPPAPPPPEAIRAVVDAARRRGGPVVLLHTRASCAERSLDDAQAVALAHALLERTGCTVASVVPLEVRHPRFVDWSGLSTGCDEFFHLIASADAFVSVDTCVVHVADARGVPGVALFATVCPEHRIAYYPHVRGLSLLPQGDGVPARVDAAQVVELLRAALDGASAGERRREGLAA